jgi:hypothetical protein
MEPSEITVFTTTSLELGRSVSMVSDYRLGDRGSIPGRGKEFLL